MKLRNIGGLVLSAALSAAMLCGCGNRAEPYITGDPSNVSTSPNTASSVQSLPGSSLAGSSNNSSGSSSKGSSGSSSNSGSSSSSKSSSSKSSSDNSSKGSSGSTSSSDKSSTTSSVISSSSSSASATPSSSSSVPASSSSTPVTPVTPGDVSTPFGKHGSLSVNGAFLVDQSGAKYQLRGMSTHGIAWFPDYINFNTFKYLRDEWNTNCIRLAMYTAENNGYCTGGDKEYIKGLVKRGVNYATQLGMYVIIDWHILSDQTPLAHKDEALRFFDEMSKLYADRGNVLYEICNEPNGGGSWEDVTAYANEVIPVIRKNSPNSVILVGTPTWSQDIDRALAAPLKFNNIMYSLHFYAATHTDWLRSRMESCIQSGLPVFVTEFGTCDASGNGGVDINQSNQWKELIERYNTSYMCWNLANKNESSSIINAGCSKLYGWTDGELSQQGRWIRDWFVSEKD